MAWREQGVSGLALPLRVYPVSQTEDAFRYMQNGTNVGKTVVEMKKDHQIMTLVNTRPGYSLPTDATYVIAGGLGGLGRGVARWMVHLGARNLILLSRKGAREQAAIDLVEELRALGAHVEAPPCDIASRRALEDVLLQYRESMPPIKGCIQGTMVLRDAMWESMTYDEWTTSISSKVQGSWNLHDLLPSGMDFFIFLSSVSGIFGNVGQSNYAAGNTYMDALAHHRVANGEKAVSINLGWMADEGAVSEQERLQAVFSAAGFLSPISQATFHALMEYYCNPHLELDDASCQVVIGIELPSTIESKGKQAPYWMQRATFRALYHMDVGSTAAKGSKGTAVNYAALFAQTTSAAEAGDIVLGALVAKVAKALSISWEDIEAQKPLSAYGIDSLLAVELRNWFAKEWHADIPIFDIMGAPNMSALSVNVAGKSKYKLETW